MIRWETGDAPAKILGFNDLLLLPDGTKVGVSVGQPTKKMVQKGVYAIIESANYIEEDEEALPDPSKIDLDFFTEIVMQGHPPKEEGEGEGEEEGEEKEQKRYYLEDVDAFLRPIVVIPNIGGDPNSYLEKALKTEWAEQFALWIDMDHKNDVLEMAPTESDSSEADELASSNSSESK